MSLPAWFDGPLPRILAHRGLALDAPENSLRAFQAAVEAGATHLETDVRATADGVAVLHHDPALPDGRAIARLPLEVLRAALPEVCTMAEALAALPGARFNVDVKSRDAALPFASAVTAAHAVERVLVASFDGRRRRAALQRLPGAATSASSIGVALTVLGSRIGTGPGGRDLVAAGLRGVHAVQVPVRALGTDLSTPWFTAAVHAVGAEVHFWVIDDAVRMRALVARGADAIVTDRADVAAEALR